MARSHHGLSVAWLALLGAAMMASSGCRGCANDHPYVPPVADGAAAAAQADAAAAAILPPREGDAGMLAQPAVVAPPATTSWKVEGMTLEAGGRELVLALFGDYDGDGKKDALAIVRPPPAERPPGSVTGELVYFTGATEPAQAMTVVAGPGLGVMPSCTGIARLERIGPRSAFAEIGSACPKGEGTRAVVVVRLPGAGAPAPSVAFDALAVDPPQAPRLSIDVDAADRDRDGIDDVVLRIAIEGGLVGSETAPRVGAKLAFFDRPAGPSRDPDEPDASLRSIAAQASSRAGKAKDAATVPPLVGQMRALYRAMCLEGGAARITKIHGGSATPCGASKPLEEAGVAEVRAFVTAGDALRAFAAAEVAQAAPATRTTARTTELQKLLAEIAPVVEARGGRTLAGGADAPHERHPEWGPLAFDSAGKLLVRRGGKVFRVEPESGEESASDVPAWKDEVLSPDGKSRLLEAYHACEGVALRATFAPTGDGDMSDVLLPIAPRLGRTCSGGRGEPATVLPITWGARGLEAIVAGTPVLMRTDGAQSLAALLDEPGPPGSPRSPSGKASVVPVITGLLVRGRGGSDRWSLVRGADLEPYTELRHCTVADDAARVACLRRGKVVVAGVP